MRPIDLVFTNLIRHARPARSRWRHPYDRGGPSFMPRETLQQLMRASTWRAHPEPFAKTKRGGQRRSERRFITGRKCGFGCE
jgi:hypothetical protein